MELALDVFLQRAQVGTGTLRQHELRTHEERRTLVLGAALAPPRLWSYLLEAALDGFGEGFHRPHDGRMSTRMHQGLRVAQQALRTRAEALIERRPPDVGLMALSLEGTQLHVLCAGPMRCYLHRRTTERLCPREETDQGLLKIVDPGWSSEQVAPGDLVIAASVAPSQERAIEELRGTLAAGKTLTPLELVQRLGAPAAEHGVGAIAVAYRVPLT